MAFTLKIGDEAPDFELPATDGTTYSRQTAGQPYEYHVGRIHPMISLTTTAAFYIIIQKLILDESIRSSIPVSVCAEQIFLSSASSLFLLNEPYPETYEEITTISFQ